MKFDPSMISASWSPQILVVKRNCTELNYYEDEYIKYFCPKTSQGFIFSIAFTSRVLGIRKVVEKFVNLFPNEKVQFVNLGAGLDTVSFWLLKNFKNVVCYDSDLEYQVKLKVDIILRTKELLNLFPNYKSTESTFSSERYNLFPCDLTNVDELNKLKDFGFSDKLPTVYLNEFVLTYIPNELSNKVIKFLSDYTSGPTIFVFHEFTNPSSIFAKWFYPIVEQEKSFMYSFYLYPTKESQVLRYKSLGWENLFVHDLTFVYNYLLDKNERSRSRKIENFNDLRNLGLFCSHFVQGVATKNFVEPASFLNYLDKFDLNKSVDNDNELLPCYTLEELETETDLDVLKSCIKNMFDVTFSVESEDFRT